MLDALRAKLESDPATYTNVALVIDAMSLRRQIVYDSREKKMTGFVDLGDGSNSEDEASEALVFMVVGFRGHWKAPIAYYLTRSLPACAQRQLLIHSLHALHEIGMRVWTVTMDGHGSNQAMCKDLGCSMSVENCSPKFKHPADPNQDIYVMYDPCHMLKLFRNMLDAYGALVSPSGKIEWNLIKNLNTAQEESGLRLANKLSLRHIKYHRQKMKVKLAAQLLSNSVASALRCLQEAGHPDFKGASATVEFLQVMAFLPPVIGQ